MPQALGDTQAAVSALAEEYRARLLEKALSYPKGESLKFRINNENFAYLTNGSLCSEELNYGENHMGTYLKAIVEEYAAKSYLERERIYLRPWFDTIQDAIAAKKQLRLQLRDKTWKFIKPYRVMPDALSMYHYIVGYALPAQTDRAAEMTSFSHRVSNLLDVKTVSAGAFLSDAAQKQLEAQLRVKGAQFMSGDSAEIKVYLTEEGIKKYHRLLHLRPSYCAIEDHSVYVFRCTPEQIKYYFFKFGAEAKVLSPRDLTQAFRQMYALAAETYGCEPR
ncbi:MAG: WYL domain-containing protein [Oscillospiraceae bacterium]